MWFFGNLLAAMACNTAWAKDSSPGSIEVQGDAVEDVQTFDIFEFRVDGNTVLEDRDVESAVYRFMGPKRTIETVNEARDSLEAAYRSAGYLTVFVDIPEQSVKDGVVMLRVTEGRVDRVKVTGSRYYSLGQIRDRVSAISEGQVPYIPKFQKQVSSLNRGSERSVTPILKPGAVPGTLQVELKVVDQNPLHGGFELNNRQSANTSEWRAIGYLRYDNLFQREHSFGVQYQTTPLDTSEIKVISGTYVMAVPDSSNIVALYAVKSNNDIAAVGDVRVIGNANIFGGRLIVPLPGKDSVTHSVTLGIDRKDFGESVRQVGSDELSTPISYTPVSAAYSLSMPGKKGTTRVSVTANAAFRGILGNSDGEFQRRRSGARANYFTLRPEVQREQKLASTLTLFGRVGGQAASQPLVSAENFFAGGLDSVRGYLEAERVGDMALYGSIELRAPGLLKPAGDRVEEFTPFAFVDAASVRVLKPLASQTSHFDLLSAGLGLRVRAWSTLSAQIVAGWPFEDGTETRKNNPRFTVRLAYDF